MLFGLLLKTPVVVDPVVAGVLDAGLHAVLMHHLMQQRCADVFDWPCERTGSDVDFIAASRDRYPSVISYLFSPPACQTLEQVI